MANVTANERAGTMTVTLRLSHPSSQDISYLTPDNWEYRGGTATFEDDYEIQYDRTNNVTITVPAGQLTRSFDITLIDDDLEEPDETVELDWVKLSSSQATPEEIYLVGTITDPPVCDTLGNLENTIIVKNLTGEITQPDQSQFHRIKLDPYRSYMIEAIGRNGLPERLQATPLKILGMKDANGNAINNTAGAGKKVFLTDWTAPSTGRFYIAVGSDGNDWTGTCWLSIIKQRP